MTPAVQQPSAGLLFGGGTLNNPFNNRQFSINRGLGPNSRVATQQQTPTNPVTQLQPSQAIGATTQGIQQAMQKLAKTALGRTITAFLPGLMTHYKAAETQVAAGATQPKDTPKPGGMGSGASPMGTGSVQGPGQSPGAKPMGAGLGAAKPAQSSGMGGRSIGMAQPTGGMGVGTVRGAGPTVSPHGILTPGWPQMRGKVATATPPKSLRDRAEMFAMRDGQVFGSLYDDTGSFGTYGGGVDPGETPEQAAIRELAEEAGQRASNARPLPFRPYVNRHFNTRTRYYLGDYDGPTGATPEPGRHDARLYPLTDALRLSAPVSATTDPGIAAANRKRKQILAYLQRAQGGVKTASTFTPTPGQTANMPQPPGPVGMQAPPPPAQLPLQPPPNGGAPIAQGMGQPSLDPTTGQPMAPMQPGQQPPQQGGTPPGPINPVTGQPITSPMQDPPPQGLPSNPRMTPPRAPEPIDMKSHNVIAGLQHDRMMEDQPMTSEDATNDMQSEASAMGSKTAGSFFSLSRAEQQSFVDRFQANLNSAIEKLSGSYTFNAEDCPKCGASMEGDPYDGKCNSCGHLWGTRTKQAMDNCYAHGCKPDGSGGCTCKGECPSCSPERNQLRRHKQAAVGQSTDNRLREYKQAAMGQSVEQSQSLDNRSNDMLPIGNSKCIKAAISQFIETILTKSAAALPGGIPNTLLNRPKWLVDLHNTGILGSSSNRVVVPGSSLLSRLLGGIRNKGQDLYAGVGGYSKTRRDLNDLKFQGLTSTRAARQAERQGVRIAKDPVSSAGSRYGYDPAASDLANMQKRRYAHMVFMANDPSAQRVYAELGADPNPLRARLFGTDTARSARRAMTNIDEAVARGQRDLKVLGVGGAAAGLGAGYGVYKASEALPEPSERSAFIKAAISRFIAPSNNCIAGTSTLFGGVQTHSDKQAMALKLTATGDEPTQDKIQNLSDWQATGQDAWDSLKKYRRTKEASTSPLFGGGKIISDAAALLDWAEEQHDEKVAGLMDVAGRITRAVGRPFTKQLPTAPYDSSVGSQHLARLRQVNQLAIESYRQRLSSLQATRQRAIAETRQPQYAPLGETLSMARPALRDSNRVDLASATRLQRKFAFRDVADPSRFAAIARAAQTGADDAVDTVNRMRQQRNDAAALKAGLGVLGGGGLLAGGGAAALAKYGAAPALMPPPDTVPVGYPQMFDDTYSTPTRALGPKQPGMTPIPAPRSTGNTTAIYRPAASQSSPTLPRANPGTRFGRFAGRAGAGIGGIAAGIGGKMVFDRLFKQGSLIGKEKLAGGNPFMLLAPGATKLAPKVLAAAERGNAAGAAGGAAKSWMSTIGQGLSSVGKSVARQAGPTASGAFMGGVVGDDVGLGGGHTSGPYGTSFNTRGMMAGAAAFNPMMRRAAQRFGVGTSTPLAGIRGAAVGGSAGAGIDQTLGAFGYNMEPVIGPDGQPMLNPDGSKVMRPGRTFTRLGAFGGMGLGSTANVGSHFSKHLAPGSMGHSIAMGSNRGMQYMRDFFKGGMDPVTMAIRKPIQWMSGGKYQGPFAKDFRGTPSMARMAGRMTAGAGLAGTAYGAATNMLDQKVQNSIREGGAHFAAEMMPEMEQWADNYMQQRGMLDEQGQFDPTAAMNRRGGMMQQGIDGILRSMGLDASHMSPIQKMMILGGAGAGGMGAMTGNPIMAGGGAAAAGLGYMGAPRLQQQQGNPQQQAMLSAMAPQNPIMPQYRDEFRHQQLLQGMG